MAKNLNVFKGKHALRDFLDPGKHPYLPMVELPPELNPLAADRVRIFAKLMTFSPLANVKALMDAMEHPEKHLDLVVRVSGYSAFFNDLNEAMKRELIGRTQYGLTSGEAVPLP